MVMSDQVRHRRRGEELERALLDAAWEELATVGFASLTMESVAARAKTGVAVLYRRWSNKDELVLAAIVNYRETHQVETPDTGSLRGDLLELLGSFSDGQSSFRAVITASFAGLLADSGMTPAEVRGRIIQDAPIKSSAVYRRAGERGEIDLDRIPEAVLSMPFDLMRHELLMTLTAVPAERILSIVDDLFLPLAARYRPAVAQAGRDLRAVSVRPVLDCAGLHGALAARQSARKNSGACWSGGSEPSETASERRGVHAVAGAHRPSTGRWAASRSTAGGRGGGHGVSYWRAARQPVPRRQAFGPGIGGLSLRTPRCLPRDLSD
jgi:AcrR family transcriptional regulator